MLSDKKLKEINSRLLCTMASQSSRRSNLQHSIDLRTISQSGESKLAFGVGQEDVYFVLVYTYRMNEAF